MIDASLSFPRTVYPPAQLSRRQSHLMKLPARFNKLAQRQAKSLAKKPREPKEWAWLNGRVV